MKNARWLFGGKNKKNFFYLQAKLKQDSSFILGWQVVTCDSMSSLTWLGDLPRYTAESQSCNKEKTVEKK